MTGTGAAALLLATFALGCNQWIRPSTTNQASVLPTGTQPAGSESPITTVSPLAIEVHTLDARFVPAGALRSANGEIIWSTGVGVAPELWRYVPGAVAPERLFVSPRPDAIIQDALASNSGYVFVETSDEAFGKGGWRLWYLSRRDAEPLELDRGLSPGAGATPTIAMDDHRIAWAGFDEPAAGPVSRLRVVSINDLTDVTTLIDHPIAAGLLWFPTLNGEELWYAIIHPPGEDDDRSEFHLELFDLSRPRAPAVRFAGIGNDFNPAVNEGFVVWKTAQGSSAALNWGILHVMHRGTEQVASIPAVNVNRPSIGNRFVTFDEIAHGRLPVYDLTTREVRDLLPSHLRGTVLVGGQSLSGNLLAFFTHAGDDAPQIGWAVLPE